MLMAIRSQRQACHSVQLQVALPLACRQPPPESSVILLHAPPLYLYYRMVFQ